MKRSVTVFFAWALFGVILIMSCISLVNGLSANRWVDQDIFTLAGDLIWGLLPIEFAFLAAFIIARQPQNLIGWLLMGPAIALANDGTFHAYFDNLTAAPASPSLGFLLAVWFYGWSWLLLIFPVFMILMLFPTGRPFSPRWKWVTLYVFGVFALGFLFIAFPQRIVPQNLDWSVKIPWGFIPNAMVDKITIPLFLTVLLSSTLLSASSMIVRYKKGTRVEREQIKWLLYACILFAETYIVAIFQNLTTGQWGEAGVFYYLTPISLMLMPAAIAIAVLRYRLWEIDILIRRTLVYALLSGLLGLVYFGGVALVQGVLTADDGRLTAVSGPPSAVAIVVTTLTIAALFNPLRRRLQDAIDRRFYRQKYDAEKALAEFAAAARSQADLPTLTTSLTSVVQDTVQPAEVKLWLRS